MLAGLWLALTLTADVGDDPSLELARQTTFVAPEGALSFDLGLTTAGVTGSDGSDPFVSVTVYGVLESPDDLDGPLPPAINRRPPLAIADLETPAAGLVRVEIPVRPGPQFDDQDRLLLPIAGVYPVTIELRTIDGQIVSAITHVVLSLIHI